MFRCGLCNKNIGPKIKQHKKTIETRPKEYINVLDKKEKHSTGWEIVKEITLCSNCMGI